MGKIDFKEINCRNFIYDIDSVLHRNTESRKHFGYLESMFGLFNTKIVILNATTEEDFQTELSEDIISIIHYFSMKMYSSRRSILKNSMELLKHTKSEDKSED